MRVVVTHISPDGTTLRRSLDTAERCDGSKWEKLAAQALAVPPPYRAFPGSPIYHIQVDNDAVLVAEHTLTGSLLELVTAVLTEGDEA